MIHGTKTCFYSSKYLSLNKALFILAISLFISWYIEPIRYFWNFIDEKSFFFLNKLLYQKKYLLYFFAFTNSRYGDWIYEIIFIFVFLLKYFDYNNKKKIRIINKKITQNI